MIEEKKVDWGNIIFNGICFIGFVGLILSLIFMYIIDAFFRNWGEFTNILISIYLSHLALWIIYKRDAARGNF